MEQLLTHWGFQTVAMLLTVGLIPRLRVTSIFGAAFIVIALALFNSTLWDASLFFNIPDVLSLQVALLVGVNGLIFWILVKLLPGIEVQGFLPALLAPVVFSILNVLVLNYGREIDWSIVWENTRNFFEVAKSYFLSAKPGVTE